MDEFLRNFCKGMPWDKKQLISEISGNCHGGKH